MRNSAQLALPFDSADLRTGEVGQLIILSYRGRFVLAVKDRSDEGVSAIEGDDETLLAIAEGVRR